MFRVWVTMVSPHVWGSLASAGGGKASALRLTGPWYSSSALDYYLRKHFMHGVTFGNINGMSAQFLSAAPAGFIEAFQRNLLYFKQYQHLRRLPPRTHAGSGLECGPVSV